MKISRQNTCGVLEEDTFGTLKEINLQCFFRGWNFHREPAEIIFLFTRFLCWIPPTRLGLQVDIGAGHLEGEGWTQKEYPGPSVWGIFLFVPSKLFLEYFLPPEGMDTSKKSWQPPFCPNPNCLYHNRVQKNWPCKRAGYFRRHIPPFRIQRFTCLHCRRSFSSQTFSTTYWLKKPYIASQLFTKVTGCMSNRQIARDLKVSPNAIDRQISRLARHCILFHRRMIQGLEPPTQVVVDGFESFEYSQYFPIHHHVAVEKDTDFFIYFTDSPLRRKGRMKPVQRNRRAQLENALGRPDPKAIEKDMEELIKVTLKGARSAVVYSDDHRAYPRSISNVDCRIRQEITPGSEHRDQSNSLWEVNLLDLLIRHCSSNHKRETIAWSKRRQGSAERLVIFLVWRNYMKGRREKERGSPTPAMMKGLAGRPLEPPDILGSRIFRSQMELPQRWAEYYDQAVETVPLGKNRKHDLKYAY